MTIFNTPPKTPCFAMLLLALGLWSTDASATDRIYGTGSSAATTITAAANGDSILLSGTTGNMTVAGASYAIADGVRTDGQFNIGNKEDLTFKAQSYDAQKWAVMQGAGNYGMILIAAVSTTRTLTLDRVIITGGGVLANSGGGMRVQGTADTTLLIKGDVVFANNAAEQNGGAVQSSNSVIFEGETLFADNKAGYLNSTGAFASARHGGAYYSSGASNVPVVTFKKNATFASNTTTASGGAIFMDVGHTFIFEENAVFRNNESGVSVGTSYTGGGVYSNTSSQLIVYGTAIFDSNKTRNGGGGLTTLPSAYISFLGDTKITGNEAGTFGADVDGGGLVLNVSATLSVTGNLKVSGNRTTRSGGGLLLAGKTIFAATPGAIMEVTDNFAGRAGVDTGRGGGIYTGTNFALARDYIISGNQALGSGGGLFAKGAAFTSSGTFSGNIASDNAGAIWIEGAAQSLALSSNTVIENNMAGGLGGGVYFGYTGGALILSAASGDIIFRGNKAGVTIDSSAVATGGTLTYTAGSGSANAVHFAGSTGTITITAAAGQTVYFNDPISASPTTVLTVAKTGDGAVVFDRHHSAVIASTTVSAGEFRLTNSATYGAVNSGTFLVDYNGILSGNGRINAAKIALNGYSGGTQLGATLRPMGGLLYLDAADLGTFNVRQLEGSGTITTSISKNYYIKRVNVGIPGQDGPQTLNITAVGTFNFMNDSSLSVDLFDDNKSDLLNVVGGVAGQTNGLTLIDIGQNATGSFTLITWTGAGTSLWASGVTPVVSYNGIIGTARASGKLEIIGKSLVLTNTAFSLEMEWTGAGTDRLWTSESGTSGNWTDGGATAEKYFRTGDRVGFTGAGSGTVTVAAQGVIASEMNVGGAQDYIFAGSGINVTGSSAGAYTKISASGTTGKLTKRDTGALVFANTATNFFEQGIDIHGGIVAFSKVDQLRTGDGAGIAILDSGTLRADAAIGGASGTLATSVNITAGKTFTFDTQANDVAYSGTITAAAATSVFAKNGAGSLTLFANNDAFSGTTSINAGRLVLASNNARLGGAIHIARGATLVGMGDSTNAKVYVNGGMLDIGATSAASGTLSLNSLMLDSGTVQFTLFQGGVSDQLRVAAPANATIGASGTGYINVFADFTSDAPVIYNLGNIASLFGKLGVKVAGESIDSTSRQEASLSTSSNDLLLSYGTDKSRYMLWTLSGNTNGVWSEGAANWSDYGETSVKNKFLSGDTVKFAGAFSSTVTIDTGGAPHVRASDMIVDTTGTLTFAGAGIFTSATNTLTGITNPAGKLVKRGAGELSFANGANYFEGGIEINEGTLSFSDAAQLGIPAATAITFSANATLKATGNTGEVTSALSIGDKTITLDTQGHTVALAGALTGSGTLVKAGSGVLAISNTFALGHAATRIDDGLVKLDALASSAGVTLAHAFELNGGWLDLSDTPDASPANVWNLTISGTTGGVIGNNDQINIGAETIGYQIGGASAADQGVYVVIAAGSGTAALTHANNYAGYTRIDSGVLNVTSDSQLGDTTLSREVILNGGVLQIADNLDSRRQIELRATGTVIVNAGKTTTWAGTRENGGSFDFTKDGEGTLVLGGALNHTGGSLVKSGTLQGSSDTLRGLITTEATLVLRETGSSAFSGTIRGPGVFAKTGAGILSPGTAASVTTGTIRIDEGVLLSNRDNAFTAISQFIIGATGTLTGSGTLHAPTFINRGLVAGPRAAALAAGSAATQDYGVINLNGDYIGDGGKLALAVLLQDNLALKADQLRITGSAGGVTNISLLITGTTYSTGTNNTALIIAEGGATKNTFKLDKRYASTNGRDLGLYYSPDDGTFSLDYAVVSPEVPAIIGADAAALLIGRASLDTLSNRMLAARISDTPHDFQLWSQGLYRRDEMTDALYDGAVVNTNGIQIGGDLVTSNDKRSITFGVFYDYAKSDMDMPDHTSITQTESNGAGVYIDLKSGGFHMNAIIRGSRENYDVQIPDTPLLSMKGNSWAAAIELGYLIRGNREWNVEPQVQLTYQTHNIDDVVDAYDRRFSLDATESLMARAGIMIWQEYAWKRELHIKPWLRASATTELKGKSALHISERYSYDPDFTYENDFGGGGGIVDAGFTMELGRGVNFFGEASWRFGGKLEGYGFNGGLSIAW